MGQLLPIVLQECMATYAMRRAKAVYWSMVGKSRSRRAPKEDSGMRLWRRMPLKLSARSYQARNLIERADRICCHTADVMVASSHHPSSQPQPHRDRHMRINQLFPHVLIDASRRAVSFVACAQYRLVAMKDHTCRREISSAIGQPRSHGKITKESKHQARNRGGQVLSDRRP